MTGTGSDGDANSASNTSQEPMVVQSGVSGTAIAVTGRVDGDIVVYRHFDRFRVEQFPAPALAKRTFPPSQLLKAGNGVVPFDLQSRREAITRLGYWRDNTLQDRAVMLVHGAGGQGKTRLASYFAELSGADSWLAVNARHFGDARLGPPTGDERTEDVRGILLVIDYADRWPADDLRLVLNHYVQRQELPVRVLALARSATSWWAGLAAAFEDVGCHTAVMRLDPVDELAGQRHRLFTEARAAFSDFLGHEGLAFGAELPRLEGKGYGTVLALHMAALADVFAAASGTTAPTAIDQVSRYLIGREYLHWGQQRSARQITSSNEALASAVITAILIGARPAKECVEWAVGTGLASDSQSAAVLIRDHSLSYPAAVAGYAFEPMQPDRLAEDFLAWHLVGGTSDTMDLSLIDAGRIIEAVLASAEAQPLIALAASAQRHADVGEKVLWPHLRDSPGAAVAAGGPVLLAIAEALPDDLLTAVVKSLPPPKRMDRLAAGRAVLFQRYAHQQLGVTSDPVQRADIYTQLAITLHATGLTAEETAATWEAVKLYRMLSKAEPQTYVKRLAWALDAHAGALAMTGDFLAALSHSEEAVGIYRRLCTVDPAKHGLDYSRLLTNHGTWLARQRRTGEASTVQQQALGIRRAVNASLGNAGAQMDLAATLTQLGLTRLHERDLKAALELTAEAVQLYRAALAAAGPDFDEGKLAHSVDIHARVLMFAERWDEALPLLHEATDIARRVIDVNAHVGRTLLKQLLSEVGVVLLNLKPHSPEGVEALREAVELFGRPIEGQVIDPNLVDLLTNFGRGLWTLDRPEEAMAAMEDAARTARKLLAQIPGEAPLVGRTLMKLAETRYQNSDWQGALAAAAEAEVVLLGDPTRTPDDALPEELAVVRRITAAARQALDR